jgi:hypothetical protein
MKQGISPIFGGVIIAVVLAIAIWFGVRSTGPMAKSHEAVDMKKMMGGGQAKVAPPTTRPGNYGGPPGAGR